MNPIVWYIHGANSSPASFAYHKLMMKPHEYVDMAYSCDSPVAEIIDSLAFKARKETRPIRIIAHSLGGIIGVSVAQRCSNVERVATMGTPFGGSKIAAMLRWISTSQLLHDTHPQSRAILDLLHSHVPCPVMSLVTTKGHSIVMTEPNDGVVTVASQQALRGATYITVQTNHFEVLLSEEVSDLLEGFILE